MPIKVNANGKTFTFADGTSQDQIGTALDEYFGSQSQKQQIPVQQQPKQEMSPWESFKRSYGEELFGAPERGQAYIEMQKYKPGTPQYKAAEAKLLAKAPQRGEGVGGMVGSALGGTLQALQELNPFGSTYGGIRTPQAAEEYIRRAQQQPQETPQQRLAKASEYGQASYLGNVLGAGVGGGVTRLGTAVKQGIGGTVAGRVADVGAGKEITPTDVGTDFLINAALGGLTHTTPTRVAKQAGIKAQREAAFARAQQEAQTKATQVAQAEAAANQLTAPANKGPYEYIGQQYEMQMPGAKGTKQGKQAIAAQEKMRGPIAPEETPITGLTPQEQAAQLDMFAEDNRRRVDQNILEEQLRQSHEAQAEESARMIEQARAEEAAGLQREAEARQARQQQEQMYGELFTQAEGRNLPKQEVSPAFEQQMLFGEPGTQPISQLGQRVPERAQILSGLYENAVGGRELSPFGEAGVKLVDEQGRPISSRGLGIETQPKLKPEQIPEFWKSVESGKAWDKFKAAQEQERIKSWQRGVQQEATNRQLEILQGQMERTPSPNYGMGAVTRDFVNRRAVELANRRIGGKQGGFVDPSVFAEGIMMAIRHVTSGVKNFYKFSKDLVTKFGETIKPYVKAIWDSANEHVSSLGKRGPVKKEPEITSSPLHVLGAEETPAIAKESLGEVLQRTKEENNGNLPDIKSNINKWMMPTNQFLKYENNPILSYGIHKADQIKATVRDAFQQQVFGEHMKGATPKFGNTGAAAMFKLPKQALEDLLEATRPYWNKEIPINLEAIGLTDAQKHAWTEYRKAVDWILDEQNKRRAELGMDPISKEANYMPRMRLGDFTVMAKDKNGNLVHYSAYPNIVEAKLAAQKLKQQGLSVETPMKGQVVTGGLNAMMKGPESFSKHQQMVAGARAMEAADVPGFAGDLKPKEMIDALHQYFSQAQRDLVGLELRKLDRELNGNVPPKVYAKIMEHMDKQVGLNYLHSPDWLNDIAKGISKYSGGFIKPGQHLSVANRAFMIYKVLWSPVQLAQALIAPLQMVNPHISSLVQEGINGNALRKDLADTTIRMLAGQLTPDEVNISSKALRSGYLANIRELGELQAQLSGHKTLGAVKEFLQDPFMSSKVDLANRQAYFLAGYKHLKALGKSSEEALHTAGRWTKEAYIDVSPEGKAPWVSQMGPASSIMGGLSTYSTGMASQLINYIKLARDKKAAAPVLLALTAALVAGGLRGMPGMGTGEALASAWNKMFPESSISGPDDFLMELAKKYPATKDLIHGVVSSRLGVDWSKSFGLPGPTEAIPAVGALMEGKLPATITGLGSMAKGAYDLAQEQMGNKVLTPREKEQAVQQVLPRGLQRIHYGQDVLDQQSNLLGQISPEAQKIAAMTGSRSLEEAQLRSKEHVIKQQSQQLSAQAKAADSNLSKSLLYGTQVQQDKAFDSWLNTYVELAPKGKMPNIDNVVNDLVDRVIGSSTLPEERDMLKERVTELLLRQGYANNEKGQ